MPKPIPKKLLFGIGVLVVVVASLSLAVKGPSLNAIFWLLVGALTIVNYAR